MARIKLITDSASDIDTTQLIKYGITMLHIPITLDGKGYHDKQDFTPDEFYQLLLKAKEIPSTSHITATAYAEQYHRFYKEGYTDIINVTIASKGSNMFEAASLGKRLFLEEHPEAAERVQIYPVDSGSYSMGYGYAVTEAMKLAEQGKSAREVLDYLADYFACVEIYMGVYSLEFAKKSGRINAAAGFVGDVLGLRPLISLIGGETRIVEKVRGDKNVVPGLVQIVKERRADPDSPIILMGGLLWDTADQLNTQLVKALGEVTHGPFKVGACIAINSGPKVVGCAIRGKRRIDAR